MAENRYYWLKLQEDFFDSKRIKKLRRIAGGDTYTIIYLKMQLMAMKRDGILEYTGLLTGVPILTYGIPAVLSCYFDIFSGFVQAYVFTLLTMVYIAGSLPEPTQETAE